MKKVTAIMDESMANTVKIIIDSDGAEIQKSVTFDNYISSLKQLSGGENCRTGRLPQGILDMDMSLNEINNGIYTGKLALFVPSGQRLITYQYLDSNKKKKSSTALLPFPSLIFYFEMNDSKIIDSKVYAVKEKSISSIDNETLLFNYPFGNVSPGTGSICWGGNALEKLSSLLDIDRLIVLFFSAPMNNDLYWVGVSNSTGLNQQGFLSSILDSEKFEPEWLVSNSKTFSSLF